MSFLHFFFFFFHVVLTQTVNCGPSLHQPAVPTFGLSFDLFSHFPLRVQLVRSINLAFLDRDVAQLKIYLGSKKEIKETLIIACTLRTNSGCEVKHESVKRFLSVL